MILAMNSSCPSDVEKSIAEDMRMTLIFGRLSGITEGLTTIPSAQMPPKVSYLPVAQAIRAFERWERGRRFAFSFSGDAPDFGFITLETCH